ncbi:STAS domain-containing protein [Thalassotalea psychrophila]|uniref:STAS domain-containing protein n=1 Tax=Thalassotalea psychrophila TaxID=3065647 RepID=A0ABY9TVX8_9GAMM|nr:STAS domain-containing protein [Colwelliaceae bacterium SQ149]
MPTQFNINIISTEQSALTGHLTRQSIAGKQERVFAKLTKNKLQEIDLSQVSKFDTAGLAWLLALIEYANKQQTEITYSQVPMELVKLAKLSGVQTLLPISA